MNPIRLKRELLDFCRQHVELRHSKIRKSISDIEESLFGESKSSVGDKHETARAMLQIDRENAGRQLREVEILVQILNKIDVEAKSDYARLGSIVSTDNFTYFISLSVGSIIMDEKEYLCVALNSPVGSLLSGKKAGEEFNLNGNIQKIKNVY